MIEFRMPSLGADMDAGTLVEWMKKPGDPVQRGDIIAVVETQKGAIEIEVFDDGVLAETLAKPGEKVPVGHIMATIRGKDERPGEVSIEPKAFAKSAEAAPAATMPKQTIPLSTAEISAVRAAITPAARRRAAELGIDPATIMPGKDGIIGLDQVDATKRAAPARAPAGISFDEMRKAIAAAMAKSHREIPHYYVSSTIDVSPLIAWLEVENARRPVTARLLYAVPLIRALALALAKTPELNGHYVDGCFLPAQNVNMGIAIAMRGGGLIAPAIGGVEALNLDLLMDKLRDLVGRVRGGRLRSSELSEGTITFSNLGEETADEVFPLIYPPQVAIIGCGKISERPWVTDGKVVVRRTMTISVAGDHRVSDGRRAAQFLSRFEQLLRRPEML
ncbi:dihydrolipoamide acetyltransferase family protein [Hyphomicrobium sp. 99]|uniref:dihydrolipoamide acetyltransferase family protein n=1 Tax=Hyphomicrobium sp. 99 TaxID=1163419 RepID=UPI0005F8066B|nr:dihydrolipoamide acetyltransferase family protein [Hyphomicrobium sp. 99]